MVTVSLLVYASVKSYSLKGKLLTKKDLETLAESRDLDELVTRIKNTSYSEAVSKVQKPFTSQKIELALRDRQADLHYTMMRAVGGSDIMFAYYLKFILRNLKLILKGKLLGRTQEEIEAYLSLHPEELIRERDVVLKALIARDFEEAVSTLKNMGIGQEVEKAYHLYNERKQIQILDLYFDKFFYENLSHAIKNSLNFNLRNLCELEIDYYNILSILRGKFWNLDENEIQSLLISQISTASKDLLNKMISAESVKAALNELVTTKFKELVSHPDLENEVISEFERAFDRLIYNSMHGQFVHVFSSSTVVAITRLVEYEVRNLASIIYAVEQKTPSQLTMSKLILAES